MLPIAPKVNDSRPMRAKAGISEVMSLIYTLDDTGGDASEEKTRNVGGKWEGLESQ